MRTTPRGQRVLRIVGGILMLDCFSCAAISLAIGGDALGGKVEDGSCYVGHRNQFVAVSAAFYYYSFAHLISILAMSLVLFVTVLRLMWTRDLEL